MKSCRKHTKGPEVRYGNNLLHTSDSQKGHHRANTIESVYQFWCHLALETTHTQLVEPPCFLSKPCHVPECFQSTGAMCYAVSPCCPAVFLKQPWKAQTDHPLARQRCYLQALLAKPAASCQKMTGGKKGSFPHSSLVLIFSPLITIHFESFIYREHGMYAGS